MFSCGLMTCKGCSGTSIRLGLSNSWGFKFFYLFIYLNLVIKMTLCFHTSSCLNFSSHSYCCSSYHLNFFFSFSSPFYLSVSNPPLLKQSHAIKYCNSYHMVILSINYVTTKPTTVYITVSETGFQSVPALTYFFFCLHLNFD